MIFAKKKVTTEHTVETCPGCKMSRQRKFADGDVVFAQSSACSACGQTMMIGKIFAQTEEM